MITIGRSGRITWLFLSAFMCVATAWFAVKISGSPRVSGLPTSALALAVIGGCAVVAVAMRAQVTVAFGVLLAAGSVTGVLVRDIHVPNAPATILSLMLIVSVRCVASPVARVRPNKAEMVALACIAAGTALSLALTVDGALSTITLGLLTGLVPITCYWVARSGAIAPGDAAWLIAVAGGIGAFFAITQWLLDFPSLPIGTVSHNLSSSGSTIHPGGYIGAVEGGASMAAGTLAAFTLSLSPRRSGIARIGAMALTGANLLGLLLTERRGLYLAFAIGLVIVLVFNSRAFVKRPSALVAAVIAIGIGLFLITGPLSSTAGQRILSLDSANGRSSVQVRADELTSIRSWVYNRPWGFGPGTAIVADRFGDSQTIVSDSYWGAVGTEFGVLGFIGIVLLVGSGVARGLHKLLKSASPQERSVPPLWLAIVIGLGFVNVGTNATYLMPASFIFWLAVGFCHTGRTSARETEIRGA